MASLLPRRHALVAMLALLAAVSVRGSALEAPLPAPEAFQHGVVFGLFAREEQGHIEKNLAEIRALGADAISIVVPWVTPNVRSMRIAPRDDMTPSDDALRRAIREAHRLGMRVLLMPIIYVDEMGEGEWRGTIDPPDWKGWFEEYGRMILRYAALAEEEKVEYLSVGSELCSTESRGDAWLALLGSVRALYGGALTYSANWDHREPVTFAGALDYVGTNAYFELSEEPEAGVETLKAAWQPIVREVEAWRAKSGKPLVITEIGYPSRRGAARDPWDYTAEAPPDTGAQARAYQAFMEAWTGQTGLGGVYFYIWWGEGGPGDTGYTPRGKRAEEVLRRWYRSKALGSHP